MFALKFSDQGTGSFVNMMSFMCFASQIGGVRVVEPFMVRSLLGLNVRANWTEEVKFRDVFDYDKAQKLARQEHFGQLVPFDHFLRDSPRKLLVAQHKCTICAIRCGHPDALEVGRTFSRLNGFEVVGQVCLDYETSGKTTLKEIERQLYRNFTKSEVVVMFLHFGGLEATKYDPKNVYRLYISLPSQCYRYHCSKLSYIRPSTLVKESAQRYIDRYLAGKNYVSVMIRLELLLRGGKKLPDFTKNCLNQVHQKINEIRGKVGIGNLFMCLDVGKYGSEGMRYDSIMKPIVPLYDSFLSQTLEDGMTLSKLDTTFTNATPIDNPGFVAMMQKTIAARGDVLVLLGGNSNFHKSATELYKSLHEKQRIFKLGNSCQ